MALTAKQFNYLNEMGVSLWQRKAGQVNVQQAAIEHNLKIDNAKLQKTQLFKDVLTYFQLNEGEFNVLENRIQFDFFDWCFSNEADMSFTNQQLTTPELSRISESSLLKKQLWQQLQQLSNS